MTTATLNSYRVTYNERATFRPIRATYVEAESKEAALAMVTTPNGEIKRVKRVYC